MARVRVNNRRLREFTRRAAALEQLAMAVGQLDTRATYPAGHVGRKSRKKRKGKTTRRVLSRADIEQSMRDRQRDGLIDAPKAVKRAAQRVPVVRVAAIYEAREGYHRRALAPLKMDKRRLQRSLFRGRRTAEVADRFGAKAARAVQRSLRSTGHVDTGRLIRGVRYHVWRTGGRSRLRSLRAASRRRQR
jgi:Asp-tRNA(Asn)/Glu-tRNA(Gln) amidotransferase C subunit